MFGIGSIFNAARGALNGFLGGGGSGSNVQDAADAARNSINAATEKGLRNRVEDAWNNVAAQAAIEAANLTGKITQA